MFSFKPNPKQRVINKAKSLFKVMPYDVKVTGLRPIAFDCIQLNIPTGSYYVECFVKGKHIGMANHCNWRKAYSLLVIEVEKAYLIASTSVQLNTQTG